MTSGLVYNALKQNERGVRVGLNTMFYSHYVWGILYDIFLAFLAVGAVWIFVAVQKRLGRILRVFFGYVALMIFPNALYLAVEVRHLIDGGIKNIDATVISVFVALSLLGLICAVAANLIAIKKIPLLARHVWSSAIVLSFLATWGTALGLLRLNSIDGILFPPVIIFASAKIITTEKWLLFVAVSTLFLTVTTLSTDTIWHRWRHRSARGRN